MKNRTLTVRKIVSLLNNREEDGGFWLPNIQRSFVWKEEQLCRLFDSIMREYPIGTLLVWKTTSDIRHRRFIDNWTDDLGLQLSDFYVPSDNSKKSLVLDGQQRLQALFMGLRGSLEGKELYFNVMSGNTTPPEDMKYAFEFHEPKDSSFPWVKFKDLIYLDRKPRVVCDDLAGSAGRPLEGWELDRIEDNLNAVDRTFKMNETVTYQELDSVDSPSLYTEDDVVEVFIRANAGGTKLGKSDLMFSLLNATWETADRKMEELLDSLNRRGFAFDRDFILKTCLVLLDKGARYEVDKFRTEGVRDDIEKHWVGIAKAVQEVEDFVYNKTFIRCDEALPSYLVLTPLVYLRYHFPEAWQTARDIDTYVLRCSLAGAFSGRPDYLIDEMVKVFQEKKAFSVDDAFGVIRTQGRSLELTEDRFWQMGYGSKTIHLLFNLWYRGFDYTPAYEDNMPQVDHIFPQSVLREQRTVNPETGRMVMKYYEFDRNQLANCMLLTREENGAGRKSDTLPEQWFAGKNQLYLDMHLIPSDPELWKLDRYEDFIHERKNLIRERFKDLLVSHVSSTLTSAYAAGKPETDNRMP